MIKRTFLAVLLLLVAAPGCLYAGKAPTITVDELNAKLNDAVILDVRRGADWDSSELKIKGAHRAPSQEFQKWSAKYDKDEFLVLYCS